MDNPSSPPGYGNRYPYETTIESTIMSSFRSRFLIISLLLATTLCAAILSSWKANRERADAVSKLSAFRNEYAILDISDESKIHAISLPAFAHLHWRWKIHLPKDNSYRLCFALDNIPDSGFPRTSRQLGNAFNGSGLNKTQIDSPFILDAGFFRDGNFSWNFEVLNGTRGTRVPFSPAPKWLGSNSFDGWTIKRYGWRRTEIGEAQERFPLVRYYDTASQVYNSATGSNESKNGLLIWIEPVNS